MKWNKLYHYPPTTRSTTDGLRTYDVGQEKLPSVTTILGATKSQGAQDSIARWIASKGEKEATRIRDQAASRGTNMHKHLEQHILYKTVYESYVSHICKYNFIIRGAG